MALVYNAPIAYDSPWTYAGSLVALDAPAESLEDVMQSILQTVPAFFGQSWYYRRLTSGPAAQARTYGTMTQVTVQISGRNTVEEMDEPSGRWRRIERAKLRTSDALADLHQGDQVIDPNGLAWAVMGIASSGIGTVAYTIERDLPLVASPNRRGGV